jgi:anion-transporting  ArsA/GET3 family ATPase
MLPEPLDRPLLFVTGKGGVGRTTVALALGLLAARHGRRTIVAELAGRERAQQAFERSTASFAEVELAPGLYTISIDPQHAMEEYLRVKAGVLGAALGSSRMFGVLAMATPGMRELLSIGKVWELAQQQRRTSGAEPYDLVICDAPATGHGVGFLRTPRTFAEITRVGPVAQLADTIAGTLEDPSFTRLLAVCTPEEMPVNETLELERELRAGGLRLHAAILNARYPARFGADEAQRLGELLADGLAAQARSALRAALSEHARACAQAEQRGRLAQALRAPVLELPYLFCEQVGRGELEQLADLLEDSLPAAARAQGRAR